MESSTVLTAPGGLSVELLEEWLGGPCDTPEAFLSTLGSRVLDPRSVERVHFCLPGPVADDPDVLLTLLRTSGVTLDTCVDMLYWSLPHLSDDEKQLLVGLGGPVERAVVHLRAVPDDIAGPYRMFCARLSAQLDLSAPERELFATLVRDRVPAPASANSWVVEEIIRECSALARVTLPA